jgi:hypothetical protein
MCQNIYFWSGNRAVIRHLEPCDREFESLTVINVYSVSLL